MAQRRATKAYLVPNVAAPSGSVAVPPCTHSWWFIAAVTWAWVRVTVVAAAMDWPVGLPCGSSSGTEGCTVIGAPGLVTVERLVPGALPPTPFPKVNCHPSSGVQLGWFWVSVDGDMGSPGW